MLEWLGTGWIALKRIVSGTASKVKEHGEIQLKLSEIIDDLIAAKQENRELRAENVRLREQAERGPELVFRGSVYWPVESAADAPGPFCPKCFHSSENGPCVPMYEHNNGYKCSACSHWLRDVNHSEWEHL